MDDSKLRWLGKFVGYFVLFALLILTGAYFLMGNPATPITSPTTATPMPDAPAGQSGHDAPNKPKS